VKEEILNYIKKSGMEDISDKRLEEMIAKGIVSDIPSLYKVTMMDLLTLDKVKDKLATKMFEQIQKTKTQTLVQFINAIGIEGISATKCEKIIANGYNTLEKMMDLDVERLTQIESFAEKSSTDFVNAMKKKNKLIKSLLKIGVDVKADAVATGEGPLKGFKFCITGELSNPRAEIEKQIKMNGGVMVSSVSKNTSYLVTNEKESSSSKFVKAKELKIPIITEDELIQMMKG
jgi:DNA ligase (NAD+)